MNIISDKQYDPKHQICKNRLHRGISPEIDTDMLNRAGIWIFGNRVYF